MKKLTALLTLLFFCSAAFSQKAYFIYLQSEGAQPFFLKMKEQVYSSNASGYLILSKLQDSTYTFSIGFPQNKWPELVFSVNMDGRDKGFLLKTAEGKQWDLQDLQTQQAVNGKPLVKDRSFKTEPKEVSAFTEALSKAANDPSLKERVVPVQAIAKVEEKPPVPIPAIKKEEPAETPIQKAAVPEKKEEPVIPLKDTATQQALVSTPVIPPAVKKEETVPAVKDTSAQAAAVVVTPEEKKPAPVKDTLTQVVARALPEEKKIEPPVEEKKQEVVAGKETVDTPVQAPVTEKKEETTPPVAAYKPSVVKRKTESSTSEGFGVTYIDEYPDGKKDTVQIFIPNPKTVNRQVPPPQEESQFLPMDTEAKDLTPAKQPAQSKDKNGCTSMASETDYLKLRKKMVATDGDDAMLAASKKIFKTKCFTTEQIKNLGTLFLNDAGRYNFFDAAYLAVSDKENFAGLQAELKDAYYISRFKAMLR